VGLKIYFSHLFISAGGRPKVWLLYYIAGTCILCVVHVDMDDNNNIKGKHHKNSPFSAKKRQILLELSR
jgi:hypothetical protein